jgi:hypothetical protein
VSIDFDGLSNRILALPIAAGALGDLQAGEANQIYFLRRPTAGRPPPSLRPRDSKGRDAAA